MLKCVCENEGLRILVKRVYEQNQVITMRGLTSPTFQIELKMQKTKWIRLNRLYIQRRRIQLCACEKGMLYVTTLLPSGLKRVFSNRRQGYNGLLGGPEY